MDNQATKHIKKFLTEHNCKLQVVEPHNHRVNAAKRVIQSFKGAPSEKGPGKNHTFVGCYKLPLGQAHVYWPSGSL